MQPFPLNDPEKIDPLRDDMFGHGGGYDREKPPDLDKMWKDFNNRINRLFRWKKKKGNDPGKPDDEDDDPYNDKVNGTKGLKMALCIRSVLPLPSGWLPAFLSFRKDRPGSS